MTVPSDGHPLVLGSKCGLCCQGHLQAGVAGRGQPSPVRIPTSWYVTSPGSSPLQIGSMGPIHRGLRVLGSPTSQRGGKASPGLPCRSVLPALPCPPFPACCLESGSPSGLTPEDGLLLILSQLVTSRSGLRGSSLFIRWPRGLVELWSSGTRKRGGQRPNLRSAVCSLQGPGQGARGFRAAVWTCSGCAGESFPSWP